MTIFKTKFSLGEKVVFFNHSNETKKFTSAVPGTIKEITFDKDGARLHSENWHHIKESELATYKNAPKRLLEELTKA